MSIIKKILKPFSKPFDKFLKKYKLDKAVFVSYIFFLLSLFFVIERTYEILYTLFTGVGAWYWPPILYAFAFACIGISFAYGCSSSFVKTPSDKIKFTIWGALGLYILSFSMIVQWGNKFLWMILLKIPNFKYVIEHMPETILPAIKYGCYGIPIFTLPWIINWYINRIKDDSKYTDSIEEFEGVVPPDPYLATGPFTCEVALCVDAKSNKTVMTPEKRRYESTLIQGATGTGKTATMIEPMCAHDIEKKFFFKEISKRLGYVALQSGLATINTPVTNEYLNENFSLNYLTPKENRLDEYLNLLKDIILYHDKETNQIYYKDVGLTLVAPDAECIGRVREVAKCYNAKVNYIDPLDPTSLGMNPFVLEDPAQVAVIISTVLKGMYEADSGGESNLFFAQVTQQALENLTILLKVMYPIMHNGDMPTLEDMLKMLYDFSLVEQACEELKKDPVLFDEYKVLVGYFERNFYKPPVNINGYEIPGVIGSGRKETEKFLYGAITQLDNLLRHPGVKQIICNRDNNINFDKALANGEIITLCSQKGTLANILSKAFGMFFILAFQYAVLRRPGTEDNRVPHFLYIDEFPDYLNKETETCFTQFRKYRCGMVVSIQNLSQLERTASMKYYKDVVLTNTKTQVIFGDTNYSDSEYWSNEFGINEKWVWGGENLKPGEDLSKSQGLSGVKKDDKKKFKSHKIQELGFKTCAYRTKDATGKNKVGKGKTDFVNKKHKQPHPSKEYNFNPFLPDEYKNSDETTDYFSGVDNITEVEIIQDNQTNNVSYTNDIIQEIYNPTIEVTQTEILEEKNNNVIENIVKEENTKNSNDIIFDDFDIVFDSKSNNPNISDEELLNNAEDNQNNIEIKKKKTISIDDLDNNNNTIIFDTSNDEDDGDY